MNDTLFKRDEKVAPRGHACKNLNKEKSKLSHK
jgi:hypothetical protein